MPTAWGSSRSWWAVRGMDAAPLFTTRKVCVLVEDTHHEFGPTPDGPRVRGAVAAVVNNPFVGCYVEDLSPATDELRRLGEQLGELEHTCPKMTEPQKWFRDQDQNHVVTFLRI